MVDNSAFNTKLKLLVSFLVITLVPLIFLAIASNGILRDYEERLSHDNVAETATVTADAIGRYVKRLQTTVESSANSEHLRGNISEYNESASQYITGLLNADPTIKAVVIMDMNGAVSKNSVYADSASYTGLDAEKIADDIKFSNGVSDLSEYSASIGTKDKFICSAFIRDEQSDCIGTISFITDLSYLYETLNITLFGNSLRVMLCDCAENLYLPDSNSITPVSAVDEFKNLESVFERALKGEVGFVYDYKYNSKEFSLQSASVANTKNLDGKSWSVIAITDDTLVVGRYQDISSSVRSAIIAVSFIDIIVIIIFVMWFLRPVSNIMRILATPDLNLSSQRVLVNGNTELDYMSRQINTILDTLSESEQRYRSLVDMTDNIVFQYSLKKNAVTFSDNFNKKFSFRAISLKYEDSFLLNAGVYPDDETAYSNFLEGALSGKSTQGEFRFKTIYNDYAWYLVRCVSIRDSYNSIIKIVGVMIDINKTKSREETLMARASLDPLTQAYNRSTFELALLNEIELSQMRKGKDAVLFIDLDDFKHFNDEYNHAVGDEVLVFTAKLAKRLIGKNGFVGRFGGDEFTICCRESDGVDSAVLAQHIISGLSEGFVSENCGEHISMYCSIGIAYITPGDSDPTALIQKADSAMYSVKKSGKSNYAFYKEPASATKR